MINKTKVLRLVLSCAALMAVAGCHQAAKDASSSAEASKSASESANPVSSSINTKGLKLTVWCPSTDNDVVNTIITNFKAANATKYPEADITVKANIGEGEVFDNYKKDLTAGADVACTTDDNILKCVDGEYLDEFSDAEKAAAVTTDGAAAVGYANVGGKQYGLPYRGDNGYCLYYDSTKITDAQAGSLEAIVAAAKAANLKVHYDIKTGWYAPAVLWANGGFNRVNADGDIESNFAEDGPVAAEEALSELWGANSTTLVSDSSKDDFVSEINAGTFAAGILWNAYNDLHAASANIKCVKLPTINVGGVAKQMKTFFGYKYITVKKGLTEGTELMAHDFAAYLANKDSQKLRIALGEGPTNVELAASAEVKAIPHIAALSVMNSLGATVPQGTTTGTPDSIFFTPIAIPGTVIEASSATSGATWGDYGTGLAGAKACMQHVVASTHWKAVAA
jgi:arabinogalactan oligomer/maltooligosaccharide transport system substrate-binding protein